MRGPPLLETPLRTCQSSRLALQALRLAEPALHLGAIERLAVEGRSVERRLDLRGERVALRGQALDLTLDRVVGRVARVVRSERVRRRLQRVHRERAEGRVELLVRLGELREVAAALLHGRR